MGRRRSSRSRTGSVCFWSAVSRAGRERQARSERARAAAAGGARGGEGGARRGACRAAGLEEKRRARGDRDDVAVADAAHFDELHGMSTRGCPRRRFARFIDGPAVLRAVAEANARLRAVERSEGLASASVSDFESDTGHARLSMEAASIRRARRGVNRRRLQTGPSATRPERAAKDISFRQN